MSSISTLCEIRNTWNFFSLRQLAIDTVFFFYTAWDTFSKDLYIANYMYVFGHYIYGAGLIKFHTRWRNSSLVFQDGHKMLVYSMYRFATFSPLYNFAHSLITKDLEEQIALYLQSRGPYKYLRGTSWKLKFPFLLHFLLPHPPSFVPILYQSKIKFPWICKKSR